MKQKIYIVIPKQLAISEFEVEKETKNQYFRGDFWRHVVGKYSVPHMLWKRFYLFTPDLEEAKNNLLAIVEQKLREKERELNQERKRYEELRLEVSKQGL